MELTTEQQGAMDDIVSWYREGGYRPLTLGGYAGTGKTTLLGKLKESLPGSRIVYCSYTGKAVSVMRGKLPKGSETSTLHRLLYRPRKVEVCAESDEPIHLALFDDDDIGGKCDEHAKRDKPCEKKNKLDWSPNPFPLEGIDLVVVDEASMVSESIWHDLTKHGVPVLAVGDHGQLPPIKSDFNLMADPQLKLEKILRQAEGNPIIKMATMARLDGRIPISDFGQNCLKVPPFKRSSVIPKLRPQNGDLALCAMNRTRVDLNDQLRNQLLGVPRGAMPQDGDIVICLRNNYEAGVFNGMRGRMRQYTPPSSDDPYAIFRTPSAVADIDLLDEDYSYRGEIAAEQFRQQKPLTDVPRSLGLWDFGYAMTVHKAQGSQAERVLIIEERLPQTDHRRWLYTAVTRASRALCVVGPR